ncbi:glucose-induced degradation complex subunit VID30 NDAI_0I03110 [Naumovozyma dairenensis CBS 421]|uniref:CTLH domain-containing protein n=1 Tax=Naumovozyma dairenensis (strain ATCC 10597 / BCRC 20456 / CBS 421 / NBRC 0211 / NRRL Y-12639) TaxID=1071378 RepID=G0WGG8_NAUDC|nr:hypothetical protein NDAI_0I03110 [Naumovozyma dairenensis CBS 421]CCD26879.1 hypothetical protein NDAI_0I03110 [Naumovozyma dairenensis CBS 421]
MSSNYMEEIDKTFVKQLFPEYLLHQPVSQELWYLYIKNKKLFNRINEQNKDPNSVASGTSNTKQKYIWNLADENADDNDDTTRINTSNALTSSLSSSLSARTDNVILPFNVKKEIWHRLMELGVLGTISFESANDNYLIQVYKYFYPKQMDLIPTIYSRNSMNANANANGFSLKNGNSFNMATEKNGNMRKPFPYNSDNDNDNDNDLWNESSRPESSRSVSLSAVNDNVSNDNVESTTIQQSVTNSNNDSHKENDDDNDEMDIDDEDEEDGDADEEIIGSETESVISRKTNTSPIYHDFQKERTPQNILRKQYENKFKFKSNHVTSDIYNIIGYFLPSHWAPPAASGVTVSRDGVMRLQSVTLSESSASSTAGLSLAATHEVYPAPSSTSAAAIRNRLNSSHPTSSTATITGKSNKNQSNYTMVKANTFIPTNKMSIFYYEIRVLSVTSSQNAQNCNILLGYNFDFSENHNANVFSINDSQQQFGRPTSAGHVMDTSFNMTTTNNLFARNRHNIHNESDDNNNNGNEDYENNDDIEGDDDDDDNDDEDDGGEDEEHEGGDPSRGQSWRRTCGSKKASKEGLDFGFFGLSGQNGSIYFGQKFEPYSIPFCRDDIIGCGINYIDSTIFFTKNGVHLGTAFRNLPDLNFIPSVALKPGNSVRTNFGLYEEFAFDISGYQDKWKNKSLQHILQPFNQKNTEMEDVEEDEDEAKAEEPDEEENNKTKDIENGIENNEHRKKSLSTFLLGPDTRYNKDGRLTKPTDTAINHLNDTENGDLIVDTLNVMINDYLIHEGMIDVAKAFLKDLQDDSVVKDSDGGNDNIVDCETLEIQREIIRHNERQILKEEKVVQIRQEIRRLVYNGDIKGCVTWINSELPNLLQSNIELSFELKIAEYLISFISNAPGMNIEETIKNGQLLTQEFVYNENIPGALRENFKRHLDNISLLLAYDDPVNEVTGDLSMYLSKEYLQDRLFQVINSNVLQFLKKKSSCSLEDIMGYTRTMLSTMRNYRIDTSGSNGNCRYYRAVNIDEDFLNI